MFCPVCKSEYRDSYTHCADCDVDLVLSLTPEADDGDHDPFVHLWSGGPGQMLAEIRSTLDDARISYRVIENKDTLFNTNYRAPYEVAVPPSRIEAAREALGWNAEDSAEEADQSGAGDNDEVIQGTLAEEEGADEATQPLDPDRWNPVEATESVWTGGDEDSVGMITSSLSENGIHWRIVGDGDADSADGEEHDAASEVEPRAAGRDAGDRHAEIRVLPSDADRAREIVREIAGSTPL
jgi:hypothetical protein